MWQLLVVLAFSCVFAGFAYRTGKLTAAAAATGAILSVLLYAGVGVAGIIVMGAFFIMAVAATSWKYSRKLSYGIAEPKKGRRDMYQVLANGGVALLVAVQALMQPGQNNYLLLVSAAFSSAAADTISSELGSLYGSRFVDILNWKKALRGQNGVVSPEGFLYGLAASIVIAVCYLLTGPGDAFSFFVIVVAGTVGNITDSVLGATLEANGSLNNNQVNFINTAAAVATAWLMLQ